MSIQTPDHEQVAAIQAEEHPLAVNEAFTGLYEAHADTMHAIAHNIVGIHDAEDIVQDAFLKLWEKRDSIKIDSNNGYSVKPWLRTVVRNKSLDQLDKRKREIKVLQADVGSLDTEGTERIRIEDLSPDARSVTSPNATNPFEHAAFTQVIETVAGLDDRHKDHIGLYASGFGPQEVADIHDIKENTAKSQARRAHKAAERIVEDELGTDVLEEFFDINIDTQQAA